MKDRVTVAITVGDINGIGPEVVLKAASRLDLRKRVRLVIVGPSACLHSQCRALNLALPLNFVDDLSELNDSADEIGVLKLRSSESVSPCFGKVDPAAGAIAGQALDLAVGLAQARKVDALVTAPICKAAFNRAGYHYPGHTEYLAEKTGCLQAVMVLMSGDLRVALATTHCALSQVPRRLEKSALRKKLHVLQNDLKLRFGIRDPRMAVAALNPHAGEGGLFGREEIDVIEPAVSECRAAGMEVSGPFAADTLFANHAKKQYDAYLAMYHDQGLIPVKMRAFGKAVNYTAGLSIIRTSPDHGTGFDIAGRGIAQPSSMEEAIKVAAELAAFDRAR